MASSQASSDYRLPTNVTPIHYALSIRTDLDISKFFGAADIDLKINEETSVIVLNALKLSFGDVSIATTDGQVFKSIAQSLDEEKERATFHFPTKLIPGSTAKLSIKFEADFAQTLPGYYKSSWKNQAGEVSFYAFTLFAPIAARRAFPCWDEPALKATFSMNMVSAIGTVNLFNMPASSEESYDAAEDPSSLFTSAPVEEEGKEWKITRFQTTPRMSTYIVAFANGQFEHLERMYTSPLTGNTIPLRIYGTAANIHQCQYTLDLTAKVLALYETAFDIGYPLPKLDTLVADDLSGACENWGLILGRAAIYCVDPVKGSLREKQAVAEIQSHEVGHMWFGNITTMEWWTYLYLNEGFASLMGSAIVPDRLWPEWKMTSKFVSSSLNNAFNLDSQLSAHPVEVDCPDANKVIQIFDALSYSKAASVLRMLSAHVGEEQFLKGVSMYMKDNLYGNTVTRDLWKGISAVTGIDVSEMMESFITKAGYPVLTVTEHENGVVHVRQDRFLKTGIASGNDNETIWHVPLNIKSVSGNGNVKIEKAILREREADFVVNTKLPFKLNGSSTGYYRVLYTPERFDAIVTEATKDNSAFDDNDCLGVLLDVMAFARAGLLGFGSALSTMFKFKSCREYLPWSVIAPEWAKMTSLWWEDAHAQDLLNEYGRALFKPIVEELGYETSPSDSPDTALLRECAVRHALQAGDKDVAQELKNRFNRYMETGDFAVIPSDLKELTFIAAVRFGGSAEYEAVRKIVEGAPSPATRSVAVMGLCMAEDPQLIQRTFEYMLEGVREQDSPWVYKGLSLNIKTRRKLAEAFKDHYDELYAKHVSGYGWAFLIRFAFGSLSSEADYRDAQDFFETKDTSAYSMNVSQWLDSIKANALCIQQSTTELLGWLEHWKASQQ
ncbi:leucyl aminopeptidase [Moniliophthora roreri MCA 2997]|uniref:Aminopeptidase n=1 Tax=Moniliophthora roreri (strain MCA 2997) TaxID=1381753 RepID=V2X7S7_MONRO|nr:leucyl aminopeptidase [Moniliophthora roreri MCA 2997]